MNLVHVVRRFMAAEAEVGKFTLPPGHLFGMEVPKGGSSCARCKFVSVDGKRCSSTYFQDWQKSMKVEDPGALPKPADQYCCDVFTAAPKP